LGWGGEAPPSVVRGAGRACPRVISSSGRCPRSPAQLLEAQGPPVCPAVSGFLPGSYFLSLLLSGCDWSLLSSCRSEGGAGPQQRSFSGSQWAPRQQPCSSKAACRAHLRKPSLPGLGTQTSQQPPLPTSPLDDAARRQAGEPTYLSA